MHVVGEVASPGIVELQVGARVADALAAAGGPTDAAVLAGVNLARTVVDGEQVVVPDAAGLVAGAPAEEGGVGPAASGGLIRLSTATAGELEQLPRIGPALAQRIIEWRSDHGPFATVDQLLDVPGIGPKTLDGFRELVEP
ncbi:ComEA family DNA-binding protein [Leucobacter luti]|nr:ComEA family DNA-binding protein [Leucobacter luti]